jgi:hypothetical protein
MGFGGCATPSSDFPGDNGHRAGQAVAVPPTASVSRNQAWRDAELLAALAPGRLTVIGAGPSMLPVYGENTVLVLQKIDFEDLVAGMDVAYRKASGAIVLHRLVAKDGHGWRASGLNNPVEDPERVMSHNLLGIVYAAFAHDGVK